MMISSKFLVVCGAAAIAATLSLGMTGAKAAENPGATIAANDNAEVAPLESEAPAAADEQSAQPAQEEADTSSPAESVAADQLKVGAAVFGADGAKIGELNRVTSDASGKVEEIRVTAGGEAGLNAKVFAIPGDKITGVQDGVRLSLSSDEAKKLPIIDNGNG
jgi:PRC-barrel domain protein